jgi:hypothetical protein
MNSEFGITRTVDSSLPMCATIDALSYSYRPPDCSCDFYFADNTPTCAVVLERLSDLPIIEDFSSVTWNVSAQKSLISVLRYPDRVNSIAIIGTHGSKVSGMISKVLDIPLPTLETLTLYDMDSLEPIHLATSLLTSIQSLRHLLVDACLTSALPLLLVTRALVDLTLSIDTVICLMEGISILPHLQRMPHLRHLQVTTSMHFSFICTVKRPPITTVPVAELVSLLFWRKCSDGVVRGWLYTPSLRKLHISVLDKYGTPHLPCLSKLVRVTRISFFAARLTISTIITTTWFARLNDPPSKIVTITNRLEAGSGSRLVAMRATIEDIFFPLSTPVAQYERIMDRVPWRKFFEEVRNVKVLRLHHCPETKVADMLRQHTTDLLPPRNEVDPDATTPSGAINSHRSQFTFYIFPSPEEIVVCARTSDTSIDESASIQTVLELFGPFLTARMRRVAL